MVESGDNAALPGGRRANAWRWQRMPARRARLVRAGQARMAAPGRRAPATIARSIQKLLDDPRHFDANTRSLLLMEALVRLDAAGQQLPPSFYLWALRILQHTPALPLASLILPPSGPVPSALVRVGRLTAYPESA